MTASGQTPGTTPSVTIPVSDYATLKAQAAGGAGNPMFNPTQEKITNLAQTSQQDITSIINSVFCCKYFIAFRIILNTPIFKQLTDIVK